MADKHLPPRPNLDQLKRQAKELQDAAQIPLYEAQTRLAREYGFASWNKLREEVEARTLEFDAAVTEFVEAATDGRVTRAERILALHPKIRNATFYTALVLGDARAVDAQLTKDPSLATTAGGPRGWLPIHYICYTAVGSDGLADIARRLIALGVDPNTKFSWLHHNVRRPILWGASRIAQSLPLVTTLLDAGTDPNAGFSENGETPLHVVARAWDVPMAEAMVARGADIARRRADGRTPYAVAELNGNRAVAESLLVENPGLRDEITDDHYIAFHQAAERGDVRAVEAMLASGFDPNRPDSGIGKPVLHTAAMEGWPDAVRVLLAHGASVNVRDREFNGQPLIWAAEGSRQGREGRDFAAVGKLLLDAGSPVEWKAGDEPAEGISEIVEGWRVRSLD